MAASRPTCEQIRARLERLLPSAIAITCITYRSSTPQYGAEADLLSGEGSRRQGGRWNPPGIAAVYAALAPETAMAEALAHNRYYGVPLAEAMPRTFVAIEIRLHSVLDVRAGLVRQRLRISLKRILTVDWRKEMSAGLEPLTQTIGRAAAATGLEGLIVPSAADSKGHNLLVFPENLRPGSTMRMLNSSQFAR